VSERGVTVAVVGTGAVAAVAAEALDGDRCEVISCRGDGDARMTVVRDGVRTSVGGRVVHDPSGVGPVDWVLLATAAVDDPRTWLDELVGPGTTIAVLQDGIDLRGRVLRWAPPTHIVPVSVTMSAQVTGDDEVTVRHPNEFITETTPAALAFTGLFRPVLPVRATKDYRTEVWRKLLLDVVVDSLTTITGGTAESCLGATLLPLSRTLLTEAVHVAETTGVAFAPSEVADTLDRIRRLGAVPSSMQTELRAGRRLEHAYITGAVIEHAGSVGVEVPVTRAVHALLEELSVDE
jgi:2-dehydropantoate 2-reductase